MRHTKRIEAWNEEMAGRFIRTNDPIPMGQNPDVYMIVGVKRNEHGHCMIHLLNARGEPLSLQIDVARFSVKAKARGTTTWNTSGWIPIKGQLQGHRHDHFVRLEVDDA